MADELRVVANSTMWQSDAWTRALVNVLTEEEARGRAPEPHPFVLACRLYRRRHEGDVVSPAGGGVAFYYALLARVFGAGRPPQVVREFFLPEHQPERLAWRFKRFLRRVAFRRTAAIVVYASQERRLAADYLALPEERFHTVLFHTNVLQPELVTEARYGFAAGRSERDYRTFFDAIRGLDYPFVVVADRASVAGLDVPGNVELHCDIPLAEYLRLLRSAAFVVVPLLPRQRSTGQVVILEAYALGKPVVATRVVGTTDYVCEGETGLLCDTEHPQQMRAAIERLLGDPAARERMGRNALALVERRHSFAVHVQQMLDVMRRVARP